MNKRIWELWGIPLIIGLVLLILGVYVNAWATGVQLRAPFTLGWIESLLFLSVRMPLWMVLIIVVAMVVAWLILRNRTKQKTDPASNMAAPETASREKDPVSVQTPPTHPAFPADGADGSRRTLVRYIMYGQDQLLAYTTTRDGLPGTRFLVVRQRPGQEPQSVSAPDRETVNAKWTE
jgi:hypothetical protein